MASSQIEIAAAPPLGCILRDRNQRDMFRESDNGRLAWQKNINEFVRDLHECSTITTTPVGLRKINARRSISPENKQEGTTSLLAREPEPCLSRSVGNSPDVSGASSLVQMWEARLNRPHSFNQTLVINSAGSSRTSSGLSNTESASSAVAHSKKLEMETDNQSQLSQPEAEEAEAESQQSASESPSERQRVKVADIIKRLTKTSSGGEDQGTSGNNNNKNDQEHSRESSPDTLNSVMSSATSSPKTMVDKFQNGGPNTCDNSPRIKDQQQSSPLEVTGESRVAFPQMSNMPRLRGRQAIQDLMMQMERDRQSEISSLHERKAVSKFTQKGRIQSMLRLKVLQRGLISSQDHLFQPPAARPKGTSSSIAARRSRFDPEADSQATSKQSEDESSSRGLNEEVAAAANNIPSDTSFSRSLCKEHTEISHSEAVKTTSESTRPCDEGVCDVVGSCSASYRSNSTAIPFPSAAEEQQQNVLPPPEHSDAEYMHEIGCMNSFVTLQDPSIEINEGSYWDGNGSILSDDDDTSQQQYVAESSCYDWFSVICRPRRYWEDRRRAWYQEVLENTSEDTEIRQLVVRKTVSNFLDSSFRLRMDQLMMTRLSHQVKPADEDTSDITTQVTMRLFCRTGQSKQQEQEETHDGEHDEEAENVEQIDLGNVIGSEYNDVSSYFEQNPVSPQLLLPSPISSGTWSIFQEPELSEKSEQTGSTRPFHYVNTGTTPTPSTNPISLEMEIINDLKGQMEQLFQEMTELRKSIGCCMDMQAKLHLSFNQEEPPVSRRKPGNNGTTVTLLKRGICCICYEMPVDSLLYRCGHMCTCLKCAQELQWSSGRCPICRSENEIMDVVRAYTDEEE